jgi:7-cyano-7-deazaguanine reductase
MLDDLVKATQPRFMRLIARFYVRGGIFTTVSAEHGKKGWKPQSRVDLAQFEPESTTR